MIPGVLPASVHGQRTLWVGRLGTDTSVVEAAQRNGTRVSGTIVNVAAGLLVQRYEAVLDAAGDVRSLRSWTVRDLSSPPAADAEPSLSVEIGDDSIRVTRAGPDGPAVTILPAVAGVVPLFDAFFNNPMALLDIALARATARGGDALPVYYIGARAVEVLDITRGDSGHVSFPYVLARQDPMLEGARLRARIGADRMLGFDARETTFKIVTTPEPWSDPLALARSFEERGLGAGGMSTMSPPRSASGRIGGVDVTVSWGQPSRRGRRIFPDVVPPGRVWRAGANAATQVTFSGDVLVGGHRVAAGSYSLWVLPGERTDTLILNRATRIWGVSHDPAQDLLRVPLRREMLDDRVEALTFTVTAAGAAGELALAWDDRRLSVRVTPASDGGSTVP